MALREIHVGNDRNFDGTISQSKHIYYYPEAISKAFLVKYSHI